MTAVLPTPAVPEKPDLDLVGLPDLQPMFGIATGTARTWRKRGVLPAPEWTVAGSPIWRREVIVAWAAATGRKVIPARRGKR